MMRHQEMERKFLLRRLPKDWKHHRSMRIVQGYFSVAGKELEIRLRHKGARYFLTIKSGQGRRRSEEEIPISAAQFRALWPFTGRAHVAKRRYEIPCRGHTVDMDVYKGPLHGLKTAEIEFDSERESHSFQPPSWLGREITGVRRYANQQLARRGLPRGHPHK